MIYGIVDLGSNTIRLSIYKYEDKTMKLLLSKKSIAGLLGYIEDGALVTQRHCKGMFRPEKASVTFWITSASAITTSLPQLHSGASAIRTRF